MMIRATGPIDFAPIDIQRCMFYKPLQKEFDLNQDFAKVLQKPGANMLISYKKTKSKMVVASRDFVANVIFNREEDGTCYHVASSSNCKFVVDVPKGTVRAETPVGGCLFKVDPNDPNKTMMTLVNEVDLKGSIPDFVLKVAFKDQGYVIDRLRKTIPKFKKVFPDGSTGP